MKGRKPNPPQLHVLNGNPGKRPIKKLGEVEPVGDAPGHLTPDQARSWNEIRALVPDEVGKPDEILVELLARSVSEMRSSGFTASVAGEIRRLCGELYLTPASRIRIAAPRKDGEENDFSEFV
ncbi:hypothetical protein [Thalassospira sp.]|uniref:hypothetical protein n=1 Tax=Thalassospira sp. TaxID=1912094 RepID=UPI001B0305D3|nr:hypothetical protein [Thalassospira sp.]MBO6807267.1 hypothetical protein [Thalassospira sp.]MBO6841674.1 hypothetical protein [Thalassospira sp.]